MQGSHYGKGLITIVQYFGIIINHLIQRATTRTRFSQYWVLLARAEQRHSGGKTW